MIMRVPTSEKRIRQSGTRVQPFVANEFTGLTEGLSAIQQALVARAATEVRAEQADLAYVNGKMSQAVSDFTDARNGFRDDLGNDNLEYVDTYSGFTRNYIDQVTSDAPSLKTKNKLLSQLNTFQISELKSVNVERDKAFQEVNTDLLTRDIASINTQIQDNWREWPQYFSNGIALYNGAREYFLIDTAFTAGVLNFTNDVAKDVITGWFREQPNKLRVLEDISKGSLDTPEVQTMYEQLNSEQREVLASNLLKQHMSFIKAENSMQKSTDDSGRIAFNQSVLRFYLADPDDDIGRQRIFDKIKLSNHMNPERLIKLQAIMNGFDSVDVPSKIFNVRMRIETGLITDHAELLDHIGEGLSYDTARTEMLPLITATNNKRFQNAQRILRNALGLPEGIIILDPKEPLREEAAALQELATIFASDPGADLLGATRNILAKREAKIKEKRATRINAKKAELKILEDETNPSEQVLLNISDLKSTIRFLESQ